MKMTAYVPVPRRSATGFITIALYVDGQTEKTSHLTFRMLRSCLAASSGVVFEKPPDNLFYLSGDSIKRQFCPTGNFLVAGADFAGGGFQEFAKYFGAHVATGFCPLVVLLGRVYPDLAHGISDTEIDDVRTFLIERLWGRSLP